MSQAGEGGMGKKGEEGWGGALAASTYVKQQGGSSMSD